MPPVSLAAAALLGLPVGLAVGLTSMGGGALLTPALVLGLGIPPSLAVGSDVLIASVIKLFGGGAYAMRRQVHWATVLRLAAGSVPGAVAGVLVLNRLPRDLLDGVVARALGAVLVLAGFVVTLRLVRPATAAARPMPGFASTALLGLATGFLVATTSVGSGSLLVCVLALNFPLPAAVLVGTDLVHALLLSSTATVGHLLSGRVDFRLAAGVLAGGVPGVLAGARLASVVPDRPLRALLALILVAVGIRFALL